MPAKTRKHAADWLCVGLACLAMTGCETVRFYSQAVGGQMEILNKARPIAKVMADPQVSSDVKRKLAVVEDARRFAAEKLALPAERPYGRYTDLGRKYVSWVLYAAPEFSVEGKTWWYPAVGRLEYRGFFSEKLAHEKAKRLQAQGYEVNVGGVEAYSTLGWFRDPVLNTFFDRTDAELAELIFHELTHIRVFLPGDTDFNEAFATANAEAGVRRWLVAKHDLHSLADYEEALTKDRAIVHLLLATREKLRRLYARQDLSVDQMRAQKEKVFRGMRERYAEIRQQWPADSRYDRSFAKPWNNARLNTVASYYDLVPAFERLLKKQRGDLPAFYEAVEEMRTMKRAERRRALGSPMSARVKPNGDPL